MNQRERQTGSGVPGTADPLFAELRRATLGDYEVLAELGRGGMAAVYLAHDLALDRKVAIKVMFPEMFAAVGGVERFQREARTAASLTHPHIVPIYAIREHERLFYFVMQFVPGRTLDSVIEDEGKLSIGMVQTILSEVGNALGYAHRNGVIHRDVKPANILLDEEGRALVADFGIAKVSQGDQLTRTGGIVGTPTYMSPEQSIAGELTGASDQYSLGIVAYELLTGHVPFAGGTFWQVMQQHCSEDPQPIAELRPECPEHIANAVLRMMAKEPNSRWPTLEEAVAAIGSAPPAEHRAIRTQMGTLAATGGTRAVLEQLRTPSSPVPPAKRSSAHAASESSSGKGLEPKGEKAATPWLIALPSIVAVIALALVAWFAIKSSLTEAPGVTQRANAVAYIRASGAIPQLVVGDRHALRAAAFDSAGSVVDAEVIWESLNPEIARVAGDNQLVAVSPGRTQILARSGPRSLPLIVEVMSPPPDPVDVASRPTRQPPARPSAPPRVVRVDVVPSAMTLTVGETRTLLATPRDQSGTPLEAREVSWQSRDTGVARVSSGQVTGLSPGATQVTATSGGISQIVSINVVPAVAASLDLSPSATQTLEVRQTASLAAAIRDANGAIMSGAVAWRSSNPAVASVSPSTGPNTTVRANSAGAATITVTGGGLERGVTVRVTEAPPPLDAQPDPQQARRDVRALLDRFDRAFGAGNLDTLLVIFPAMPTPMRDTFQRIFSARARDVRPSTQSEIGTIDAIAGTGTASIVLVYEEGRRTSRLQATLVRGAGGWIIESMAAQ